MSEIKLLPCPFCGSEAEFYRTPIKSNGGWCDSVVVRCTECEAMANRVLYNKEKHPNDEEYVEAAAAWNTRKSMQEILERLEEEREKSSDRFVGGRSNGKTLQMGITYGIEKTIRIVKEVGGMNDKAK